MKCLASLILLLALLILTGCSGVKQTSEIKARQSLSAVSAVYRPEGKKPQLPVLTQKSPLSDFLLYGILNSPDVESAYYEWAASVERITVERSLPEPRFTFQTDIMDFVKSLMPGLMFEFPGPGKLEARANVASAESLSRYYQFESAVFKTAFEIKRAYYQLYFLEDKIRVNQNILNLLNDLEAIARRRNELGLASLEDVLRIQIEQERLKTEIANLKDSRNPLLAMFKGTLGLKPEEPNPPVPEIFQTTSIEVKEETLLTNALARNPAIKAIEARINRATAAIQLARKAKVPDYSAGIELDALSSPVMARPQFAVTLPIWRDKIAAQIAEAESEKKSVEARLSQTQIYLAIDLAEKLFTYRETTRAVFLLNEQLLPKARQAVEISMANYSAGKGEFAALTENWKLLYGLELELVDAKTRRELALAELELMIASLPPSGAPILKDQSIKPQETGIKKR
ncbi:MAG: TolC family protein [Verrucomicrobiia bacterium]